MKKQLLIVLSLFSHFLSAQNPADLDRTFIPVRDVSSDNSATTLAVQSDGKIIKSGYVGNTFRINRLNTNGISDWSFNLGQFNNVVRTIVIQSDGKIIAAGDFTTFNGTTANRLIRLNADGTKDTSFNTGSLFDNVYSVVIQTDGKIIVGGDFTSFAGGTANKIVRLNTNGTRDTSFKTGTGFNGGVRSIAIESDGKIIVVGTFNLFNGITVYGIIRLNADGAANASLDAGNGYSAKSIAIQSDGKIIIGGDFTTFNGTIANRIIRLQANGAIDTTFKIGTGFNSSVKSLVIQTDGKIIVGGDFTTFGGGTVNKIIRLNTDGTRDFLFNAGTGFNFGISAIAIQPDGKIIAGGDFTTFNGSAAIGIARLRTDGTKDITFIPITWTGFDKIVNTIAIQPDRKIIVGGDFITFNTNAIANGIIRLNTDGTRDSSFNTETRFNNSVKTIAIQSDGKIIIGGLFTSFNGIVANRIIRLNTDGTIDSSFSTGTGFNYIVKAIAIQSDGKIIVGGQFTTFNGIVVNSIIRLNNDGTKDTSFITGTGFIDTNNGNFGIVNSISIQSDGKIIVGGGFFNVFNGVTANKIIRLNTDGTRDNSFNPETGRYKSSDSVNSIIIQPDGKIIVGGEFMDFNNLILNGITRLNKDGTRDSSFNTGSGIDFGFNGFVYSMAIQFDGKIIVGGDFASFARETANKIIRLNTDGTRDFLFNTGTGFDVIVKSIAIQPDGGIIVGGDFIKYNNVQVGKIVRLSGSPVLSVDKFSRNKLSFHPNPAKDFLYLNLEDNSTPQSYEIYDLLGRNIKSKTVFRNQIDVNTLSKGLYILKIKTDNETFTSKFLKE